MVRFGAGVDGACVVEFVNERGQRAFARVICEAEKTNAQDPSAGLGNDVGVGGEQGTEQLSRIGLFALRCDERGHHAGLGAVGDHADDVEEQAFGHGQGVELLGFGEFGDADMGREVLSLFLECVDLTVEVGGRGLVTFEGCVPGVLVRSGGARRRGEIWLS